MDEMLLNDIRCILAVLVLLITVVYTIREATFTTVRRVRHIYLWTDIRYKQILMLFFTVFCTLITLSSFNDLQEMITVGTMVSGWFNITEKPSIIYCYLIAITGIILLVYNYILMGKKIISKKKTMVNRQIMAEMVPLNVMVLSIWMAALLAFYGLLALDYILTGSGIQETICEIRMYIRSGLCVAAVIYMVFDARLAKRQLLNIQSISVKSIPGDSKKQIWEQDNISAHKDILKEIRYKIDRLGILNLLQQYGLWKR